MRSCSAPRPAFRVAVAAAATLAALGAPSRGAAQTPAPAERPLDAVRRYVTDSLPGPAAVYYPPGLRARADTVQRLLRGVLQVVADSLGVRDEVVAAILPESAWTAIAPRVPYGFPTVRLPTATSPGPSLAYVAAARENPTTALLRPLVRTPNAAADSELAAAGVTRDAIRTRGIDLIYAHEVGHSVERAAGVAPPSHWVDEFGATYIGYAALRARDPALAHLFVAENLLAAAGPPPAHTSLADFDRFYLGVGPMNYAWYQAQFARGAVALYARRGFALVAALRAAFPAGAGVGPAGGAAAALAPDEVLARLRKIDPALATWAAQFGSAGATGAAP